MSQHQIVIPTKDKLFNLGEFSLRRPGNMITAVILVVGFVLTFIRFTQGIGSITNLSDTMPWGMWIGFDLLCGVCLAAGGYFTTVACYVMGMKHFHSAVRPAVTTAFLGYAFVVFALLYDLGHPLRLPYMFFFPGTTSVLFEVGLCVATYLTVLFIEFSVAPMEWLSCKFPFLKKWRKVVVRCTIILTIFGVCLSTLHQSSLGALYLIAPGKLHPLWYSPFMLQYEQLNHNRPAPWLPVAPWLSLKACGPTRACTTTWTRPTCAKLTKWSSASPRPVPSSSSATSC